MIDVWKILIGAAAAGAIAACASVAPASRSSDWRVYGGGAAGNRYSPLTQIARENVSGLKQVWRYETGAGGVQTSPLMVDGVLYGVTPTQDTFALDATSGAERWRFTPAALDATRQPVRGLTFWRGGGQRVLFTSYGTYLAALDPDTGKPMESFGAKGRVDLREGLDRDPQQNAVFLTTPGVIYRDMIIVGFRTLEAAPAAPGRIRAYDVRTGKLRWQFNTMPRPGEPGGETWPASYLENEGGGANAWAGMVVDEARGIVYAPTGSGVDDFYGANRKGENLYANALVALDANTGRRLWHFQAVHHDIWDRDFPTPPVLLTVRRNGKTVDAVAQGTKQGFIFVFDRVTGAPLFPIVEKPALQSDVPGEEAWPTQPFSEKPAPFARQMLTADMLTMRTPEANAAARDLFATFDNRGPFTPLSLGKRTIVFPGFDGGAEWGGPAVDPRRGVIYVNSNDIAWTGGLVPAPAGASASRGAAIYVQNCAACHGLDLKGAPPEFPSLAGAFSRRFPGEVETIIRSGSGRMPGFPQIGDSDRAALIAYMRDPTVLDREPGAPVNASAPARRYVFAGYRKFLDPDGYPAVQPPWGTLNAIDLNTGEYLWKVPFGEYPELVAKGMADTGSENYGGPVLTASGLLFIGATIYDRKLRAFDAANGKVLWAGDLPYAGVATPITYMAGGRQYVVIAASGSRDAKGPQGSAYVAFALGD